MEANVKKAIITGAGSGLGTGIAYTLAQAGYDVAISYAHSKNRAYELAEWIKKDFGRECYVFQADFSKPEAMKKLIDDAVKALGGLDLLVNNASVTDESSSELFDLTDEKLDWLYHVNFLAYIIGMREAGTVMSKNQIAGNIVNSSSVHGKPVRPDDAVYGAFKAGSNRIIRSFALSFAPFGSRGNNIALGAFRNRTREDALVQGYDMEAYDWRDTFAATHIPFGRLGEPEEVAKMILCFASDAAAYVTGETLTADGGLMIPGMSEALEMQADEKDYGWGYMKIREFNQPK